jgi:hypothetical protein
MNQISQPPKEPKPNTQHDWIGIAAGRVCSRCGIAQMKGEFDDPGPCPGARPARAV